MKTLIAFLVMSIIFNGVGQDLNDSLRSLSISFDVHGCDCGAPDCYQTAFNFELPVDDLNPALIFMTVAETGCIEAPTVSADFVRVKESNVWSYYSAKLGMNLVLKWKDNEVVDAACIIGGQAKNWEEVNLFFDKSCQENADISVFRWRLRE